MKRKRTKKLAPDIVVAEFDRVFREFSDVWWWSDGYW
jgi:hypothetical protein